jgi:MoxR-like ATPase
MAIMVAAPVTLSKLNELEASLNSTIRGKAEVVRLSLVCLLARGHLLIEDVPGVGKTTLAHAWRAPSSATFTACSSPATCCRATCWASLFTTRTPRSFEFKTRPGFHQFPAGRRNQPRHAKTQSALLEAMNEVQVTIEAAPMPLAQPFMVIATQNPVEHHGDVSACPSRSSTAS